MDGSYDEIISENPFFMEFKNEYSNLFQHCITEAWIICVPRITSLNTRVFTVEDFCAHILVPNDELPESHYSTVTEKQVTVLNKVITVEVTKDLPLQSHILFEETFYTEDHMKYIVWCIETPLEPSVNRSIDGFANDYLSSINDCIDLLWTQAAGRQVLDHIEQNVNNFIKKNQDLPLAIASLRDLVSELYTQCLQAALQNRRLREKTKTCKHTLENVKLAVECYMEHLLYDTIFKPICTCSAYEDAHLNKKIRNLSDIQLRDLDIKKELYQAVPKAKEILSRINNYNTVMEKVICIKEALNAVNMTDHANNKRILLTADDMLPLFVFLIIKSGLPNWYSQLTYMKEFRFSSIAKGDGDESAFLITTLEAVIEHIQSGAMTGSPHPESYYYETNLTEDNIKTIERKGSSTESVSTSDTQTGEETLEYVFELIKASNREQVCNILERNQKHLSNIQLSNDFLFNLTLDMDCLEDDEDDYENVLLCHPLCSCKKCNTKISKNLLKTSPTIMSRDCHGLTPLHIACIHGKASIVESLIEMGADINVTDLNECTPLHHAASRGHQNALLLLIHSGANINSINIDKNTALHLSANNGHLNCVKALIYYAEYSKITINVNNRNQNGNTPLHMASKWGYEGIVKLLIENGAEPSLQNQKNKTAFDYAHNLRIMQVLKSCTPNLYDYIHITNTDIDNLNLKSSTATTKNDVIYGKNSTDVTKAVENLKRIDRITKAITYGDIKLACFYMNIDYEMYVESDKSQKQTSFNCHPLCECEECKKRKTCSTNFDVNFSDTQGYTALHFAARCGLDELCVILLKINANVNCVSKRGESPLHLAALNNKTSVIRLLIDSGANLNAIDLSGNTALHYASEMGNIGATKIIISYNPDILVINRYEKTVLDIAREKVYLTIIDLIEKHAMKIQDS